MRPAPSFEQFPRWRFAPHCCPKITTCPSSVRAHMFAVPASARTIDLSQSIFCHAPRCSVATHGMSRVCCVTCDPQLTIFVHKHAVTSTSTSADQRPHACYQSPGWVPAPTKGLSRKSHKIGRSPSSISMYSTNNSTPWFAVLASQTLTVSSCFIFPWVAH